MSIEELNDLLKTLSDIQRMQKYYLDEIMEITGWDIELIDYVILKEGKVLEFKKETE